MVVLELGWNIFNQKSLENDRTNYKGNKEELTKFFKYLFN